jgi:hypothetical protein
LVYDHAVLIRTLPFLLLSAMASADAVVTVNAPMPITHRLEVQPILVKNAAGTGAVFFGNAAQEAYIKEQINAIWAQVGVRIDWLAPVEYTSSFALDGSPGNYETATRPSGDLAAIRNGAGSPPKSANAIVLNAFFVDIVPAFSRTSVFTSNGYAYIDSNGMAIHVGDELLTFESGRDVIAGVVAHEIGHNCGLDHTASNGDNLMSPNGNAERLTPAQQSIVFTNNGGIDSYDFLQPIVKASNYSLWAAALGLRGGPTGDDDGDGMANVAEFMLGLQGTKADAPPLPETSGAASTWSLRKVAGAVADGLVYSVQVSTDGAAWVAAGSAGSGSEVVTDSATTLVVRHSGASGSGLLRLSVTVPAGIAGDARAFVPLEVAAELNAGRIVRECDGGDAETVAAPGGR